MNNHRFAEVLVREGIRQGAVATAPVTYPISIESDGEIDELLPRIAAMRTELQAGNVDAAVKIGHLVSGRSARLGERRVASLVRKAVTMARFYVLEQADEALSLAEAELVSKN
jgi:hypothetical protein